MSSKSDIQVRTFLIAELCGGQFDGRRSICEVGNGMSRSIFVPICEEMNVSLYEITSDLCSAPSIKTAEYRLGDEVFYVSLTRHTFIQGYQVMLDTMYREHTKTTKYHLVAPKKGDKQ